MPLYDYECTKCKSVVEKMVKMSTDKDTKYECIKCKKLTLRRILSATYGKVAGTNTPTKIKR